MAGLREMISDSFRTALKGGYVGLQPSHVRRYRSRARCRGVGVLCHACPPNGEMPLRGECDRVVDRFGNQLLSENSAVCVRGISTPGTVQATSEDLALDFQPLTKNQDFSSVVSCLSGRPVLMTGNLDFYGRVKGRGQSKDLIQSLQGPLEMEAKDGRIYQDPVAPKILAFLNLTELLVGEKTIP